MPNRELDAPTRILAVTEQIYTAALDPTAWPAALAGMRDLVDGAAVSLRVEAFAPSSLRQTWLGFEPAFQKAYLDHYWRDDVCSSGWPTGRMSTADELVPAAVRLRTAFFNDLCVPFALEDLVGGLVESSPGVSIALSIMRGRARRRFDEKHAALLDALVPHLQRAVRINAALESAERASAAAWDVFDRLPVGIFAVDGAGKLKHANRAGSRMIGNGLRIERSVLAAEGASATRALWSCLAAARAEPTERCGPVAIALPRVGGLPLSAVAMPADRDTAAGLGCPTADVLLVVTDPSARVEPPASVLMRVYGLTAAESRVALLLGRGLSPKQVAGELGTAWNTVRFQLRQVYAKTQTTGQPALVKLLVLLGVVAS